MQSAVGARSVSFNEAPAERGGKRPSRRRAACAARRFNEAPAERGGKPGRRPQHPDRRRASMRPPLNAGENRRASPTARCGAGGFNEAPAERGGKRDEEESQAIQLVELQ